MKFLILGLLIVGLSLAATDDKNKRDADFFKDFSPQLPIVTHSTQQSFDNGYVHTSLGGFGYLDQNQHQPAVNDFKQSVDEYKPPHDEYGPPHEEYGPPHEEYGPPHEEYGPPDLRIVEPTTTPHYCPTEDYQSPFVPNPPEVPHYPLPEVSKFIAPVIHEVYGPPEPELRTEPPIIHEVYGPPNHEKSVFIPPAPPVIAPLPKYIPPVTTTPVPKVYHYPAPTTTLAPPTVPKVYPYPEPITTTTEKQYPYPEPITTTTEKQYPYPEPITTTTGKQYPYPAPVTSTLPPPPPIIVKQYPYPAPVTTTEQPTTVTEKVILKSGYAAKVYSKYDDSVHVHASVVHSPVHHTHHSHHAVRYVKPKVIVAKKLVAYPLLKKKLLLFG